MPTKKRVARVQRKQAVDWLARYQTAGEPPVDSMQLRTWVARIGALLVREASTDFSTTDTGRERRRHAMTMVKWFVDSLEGAEFAERIAELERALADVRAGRQPHEEPLDA